MGDNIIYLGDIIAQGVPWVLGYVFVALVLQYIFRWIDDVETWMAWGWPVTGILTALFFVWAGIVVPIAHGLSHRLDWFILKATANMIHEDEFGQLYSRLSPDDNRPFRAVKVKDST